MSIKWVLARSLRNYIRQEADPEAINLIEWAQLHPGGCFGAEVCKCYETAEVRATYWTTGPSGDIVEATWVFAGTLAALIQMLDAYDEMVAPI